LSLILLGPNYHFMSPTSNLPTNDLTLLFLSFSLSLGELGYLTDALAKRAYCQSSPRQVVGIDSPVVAIAVGKAHTACTTQTGDVYLMGFGSPQARKLFLPAIMPSAFAAYQQQAAASSSSSRVLPTPVYSISPSQTSFALLSTEPLSMSPSTTSGSRGLRELTSLVACGNMTLVVFNRRDVFLSDLYHVDGLHTRIPKPIYIPAVPGNNTISSAALNTNKEIIVTTGMLFSFPSFPFAAAAFLPLGGDDVIPCFT
jgi:hypothetical protein